MEHNPNSLIIDDGIAYVSFELDGLFRWSQLVLPLILLEYLKSLIEFSLLPDLVEMIYEPTGDHVKLFEVALIE